MSAEINRKVLFVDDDVQMLSAVKRSLRTQFDIITALGVDEAFEQIQQHGSFAVVVSDMCMPGMNGLEFFDSIKHILPESVYIILTGSTDIDAVAHIANKGTIFRFLTKPCPNNTLISVLNDAVQHYRHSIGMTSYTYSVAVKNKCVFETERSEGCFAITGYKPKDFENDSSLRMAIVVPEHKSMHIDHFKKILEGQEVGPIEFKIRRKDSIVRWLRDIIIPHRDKDGNVIRFDGLVEDITLYKEMTHKLKLANSQLIEHDRLKTEFISMVSHEIRTPLCIFKNVISNALAGVFGKINSKLHKNLVMADESIDRLGRIINDFLDSTKIESGALVLDCSQQPIQAVVNEVLDSLMPLANEKKIKIEPHLPPDDIMVDIDKDRMAQIITNLLANAIKFSSRKGLIRLFINDHIDEVEVAVQDNGPGIATADMEHIFNRFVQVNNVFHKGQGGTGLGLSIAKKLVELHNGKIWVDSKLGEGSCFSFTIPKSSLLHTTEINRAVTVRER